jgi:excisionase family DNA binding protein
MASEGRGPSLNPRRVGRHQTDWFLAKLLRPHQLSMWERGHLRIAALAGLCRPNHGGTANKLQVGRSSPVSAANLTKATSSHAQVPETRRIHSPASLPKAPQAQQLPSRRDSNVTRSSAPRRRLLRTREAAQYLSISPWKLRRLVQDGLLPVVQENEGAAWRIDMWDLDRFIERNKRTAPL